MTTYTNPKDNGANGKNFEVAVRAYLTARTKVRRCQTMGKVDHRIKYNGKMVNIEVKLGGGTVEYNEDRHLDLDLPATAHVADLLKGADFVVYAPTWDGDPAEVANNAWVFTRKEFITMLTNYTGMVKYAGKNGTKAINIQSLNSKRRATYVWNMVMDRPTLAEWNKER